MPLEVFSTSIWTQIHKIRRLVVKECHGVPTRIGHVSQIVLYFGSKLITNEGQYLWDYSKKYLVSKDSMNLLIHLCLLLQILFVIYLAW